MPTIEQVKKAALVRLVDDDQAHCDAMKFVLENKGWNVVIYNLASTFLTEDLSSVPGCIILDVHMPEMTGLELQDRLRQNASLMPIIFLTGYGDIEMAVHTMHQGAADFFQKPVKADKLLAAVAKAATRSVSMSLPTLLSREEALNKLSTLTQRERQVAELCRIGLSSKTIGQRLNISERTVESHRASVCKKAQVHSMEELLAIIDLAQES